MEHGFNSLADEILEDRSSFGIELTANLQVSVNVVPHFEVGFATLLLESAQTTVGHQCLCSVLDVSVEIIGVHVGCGIDERWQAFNECVGLIADDLEGP
jgi:hypothetical protein